MSEMLDAALSYIGHGFKIFPVKPDKKPLTPHGLKDATQTKQPGTWGAEVPWGEGQVGIESFVSVLEEIGFNGVLAIEREAGNDRFGDIKLAAERLLEFNT